MPTQRRALTVELNAAWWVRREPSAFALLAMSCSWQQVQASGLTQLLVLSHSLVVLAVELGPFSKVVLRRCVPKLTLQLHDLLLECLASLRTFRGWSGELIVQDP